MKSKVLIVDDKPENIHALMAALDTDHAVIAATSGEQALVLAHKKPYPDIILLDVNMPGLDGFEVCRQLKGDPSTKLIPIIFITTNDELTEHEKGLRLGAVDYLIKPVVPWLVAARVNNHIELNNYRCRLESMVNAQTQSLQDLNSEIESTLLDTLQTLGEIAEVRSRETGFHVKRVMEYSFLLASLLNLPQAECELLRQAASMHDIGKMAIPDSILQKPGKLTSEEFTTMTQHAEYGHKMLASSQRELFQVAAIVALSHHEKWNGKGYPRGLAGEDIPLSGRVAAVADVFDALGSERCYKPAWEDERIFALFREERGQHFDPLLIDMFFDNIDSFLTIRDSYKD